MENNTHLAAIEQQLKTLIKHHFESFLGLHHRFKVLLNQKSF
jgi:hypothetical protein